MESTNTQNITGLKFRASSVHDLIEQMVSLRKRRSKGEDLTIPSVMLQLTSGREILCYVLDMIVGSNGTSVVVQTQVEGGQPRVVYTDLSKVEAVSFLDSKRTKKPKPSPATEKPKVSAQPPSLHASLNAPRVAFVSESDIQKLLIKFTSVWTMLFDTTVNVDVAWSTFQKTPRALVNLKEMIQNFRSAIEALGTSTRKEELRSQLQNVRFVHGVSFDIVIDSQTITVQGPLIGPVSDIPSKTAIFNKIEAKMF